MKRKNLIALAVLFAGIGLLASSCKKTSPADAVITVTDSLSHPIKGAKVVLKQNTVVNAATGAKANILDEKITDSEGNTYHSFKWEAVLNVEVSKDSLKVIDYIRLEQSNTVTKTIVLK